MDRYLCFTVVANMSTLRYRPMMENSSRAATETARMTRLAAVLVTSSSMPPWMCVPLKVACAMPMKYSQMANRALAPLASQFIVIGDGRNFASALVALDTEGITAWAAANGMEGKPYSEIVASPQARELVQGYIDELNSGLNRWETIKQFRILPRDLSVDSGDLTPSLKLRRGVVTKEFASEIDSMYAG